ncbi:cold shock domain-containing protein [Dokdonella sp.]|uniref:cold shock domain-containing protein n=1 Tax=Dokdonella sp. TaxID=2291710 RepID=UPI0035291BC5
MRKHGRLVKWNDDRGFGFISPAQGDGDLFVHVSAFPKDGKRPVVDELISFETEMGPEGKLRAIRVGRAGGSPRSRQPEASESRFSAARLVVNLLAAVLIAFVGVYVYTTHRAADDTFAVGTSQILKQDSPSNRFTCDGRTSCSQMTSCAEATYFIEHCPNTAMDGDNDGRPCESQWCNGSR